MQTSKILPILKTSGPVDDPDVLQELFNAGSHEDHDIILPLILIELGVPSPNLTRLFVEYIVGNVDVYRERQIMEWMIEGRARELHRLKSFFFIEAVNIAKGLIRERSTGAKIQYEQCRILSEAIRQYKNCEDPKISPRSIHKLVLRSPRPRKASTGTFVPISLLTGPMRPSLSHPPSGGHFDLFECLSTSI